MRQFETLRKRYDSRSQWFQVGLASATLLTPLLKRWNDLRAAEQARAWREEAETRLRAVRWWNPRQKNDARKAQEAIEQVVTPRGNVSATIWLAGVGVGLLAAGTGAYLLVRRRMRQEQEEPMLDLPVPSTNGNGAPVGETALAVAQGIRQRDEQATSAAARNGAIPASAPLPSASPAPAMPSQSSVQASDVTGPLMPPPNTATTANTTPTQATAAPTSEVGTPDELPGGGTSLTESGAPAGVANANSAAFVGNIHTMVYHAADADDLPAEENRIYFASEDEAHDAGYRRARDEVSSGGE